MADESLENYFRSCHIEDDKYCIGDFVLMKKKFQTMDEARVVRIEAFQNQSPKYGTDGKIVTLVTKFLRKGDVPGLKQQEKELIMDNRETSENYHIISASDIQYSCGVLHAKDLRKDDKDSFYYKSGYNGKRVTALSDHDLRPRFPYEVVKTSDENKNPKHPRKGINPATPAVPLKKKPISGSHKRVNLATSAGPLSNLTDNESDSKSSDIDDIFSERMRRAIRHNTTQAKRDAVLSVGNTRKEQRAVTRKSFIDCDNFDAEDDPTRLSSNKSLTSAKRSVSTSLSTTDDKLTTPTTRLRQQAALFTHVATPAGSNSRRSMSGVAPRGNNSSKKVETRKNLIESVEYAEESSQATALSGIGSTTEDPCEVSTDGRSRRVRSSSRSRRVRSSSRSRRVRSSSRSRSVRSSSRSRRVRSSSRSRNQCTSNGQASSSQQSYAVSVHTSAKLSKPSVTTPRTQTHASVTTPRTQTHASKQTTKETVYTSVKTAKTSIHTVVTPSRLRRMEVDEKSRGNVDEPGLTVSRSSRHADADKEKCAVEIVSNKQPSTSVRKSAISDGKTGVSQSTVTKSSNETASRARRSCTRNISYCMDIKPLDEEIDVDESEKIVISDSLASKQFGKHTQAETGASGGVQWSMKKACNDRNGANTTVEIMGSQGVDASISKVVRPQRKSTVSSSLQQSQPTSVRSKSLTVASRNQRGSSVSKPTIDEKKEELSKRNTSRKRAYHLDTDLIESNSDTESSQDDESDSDVFNKRTLRSRSTQPKAPAATAVTKSTTDDVAEAHNCETVRRSERKRGDMNKNISKADGEVDWTNSEVISSDTDSDSTDGHFQPAVKRTRRKSAKDTISSHSSRKMHTVSSGSRRRLTTYTPSVPERKNPLKECGTALERARAQLHVSVVPDSLPCREEEFANILSYVESKLENGTGGCLYISGVPGTGKTATVYEVLRYLNRSLAEQAIPGFKFVEINGMRLTQPHQAFVQIYKCLTQKQVTADHATHLLDVMFCKTRRQERIVLLVDELDLLMTRKQDVLYNLFDWPTKPNSRLIVLAIANTMDLPERVMMNRVSSRLGLNRMTFQPYTFQQLQEIVHSRLSGIPAFDPDAVQLASRKVAAVSGDARRALDICRRSTEVAENAGDKIVVMSHVDTALQEMFTSPKINAIRNSSLYEKVVLKAIVAEFTRSGLEEAMLYQVFRHIPALCAMERMPVMKMTQMSLVCSNLNNIKIVLLECNGSGIYQRVRLNVGQDDVEYALLHDEKPM